jgi:hypothetical protein
MGFILRQLHRRPAMPQDANLLIWIDMEMTGLKPETDRIIEVALVVTDNNLTTVAEAPVLVVRQDDATLSAMDSWNRSTHAKSGLIDKVKASTLDEPAVEARMLAFLREYVPPGFRRCAAIRSARTGVSSRAGCRRSRTISTIGTSTSRPSRSCAGAGSRMLPRAG